MNCFLKEAGKVPVAVWSVTERDEASLDFYEGFPIFYYKKELTLPVMDFQSKKVRNRACFVYIMHEDRKIGIPDRSYMNTCLEGYRSFGFDEYYLNEAFRKAKNLGS